MNSVETADYSVLYATFPNRDEADTVARRLVREGLANFVNINPGATTFYRENGDSEEVRSNSEVLMTAKILTRHAARIVAFITAEHPLDDPEVYTTPISHLSGPLYSNLLSTLS